jgi:phosphoribosylanthranilate isomerase
MSGRQQVKICGISDPQTARYAVEQGADYIGINFYPGSHRYVTLDRARQISEAARAACNGQDLQIVGLFVNEPVEKVMRVRELAALDMIQLSGDEPASDMQALRAALIPFIGTVRAGNDDPQAAVSRFGELVEQRPHAVMLDTHVPGKWGGSGVVGNWNLARELAEDYPLFLAGGLDPENVRRAAEYVRPLVVDVSSGVETNKIKDHDKIRAFIAAARGRESDPS